MSSARPRILSGGKSDFEKEHIGLGEFFFRQADKYGEKVLQIDPASAAKETYQSIKTKSIRLALNLKQFGLTADDIVVSCLGKKSESILPHIATLYLGAKICALDPNQSEREYIHCLNLIQPKIIFSLEQCLQTIENAVDTLSVKPTVVVLGKSNKHKTFEDFQKVLPDEEKFQPSVCQNCHDTAIIFLSSGTTGLSKAVCISHYSLLNGTKVFTLMDNFNPSVILTYSSFYWVTSMIYLTIIHHTGGSRIVPETFEPTKMLKIIEEYKVTYLPIASQTAHSILEVIHQDSYDLSSLYSVLCVGGAVPPEKLQQLRSCLGTNRITTGYGITEGGMSCVLFDFTRDKGALDKFGSSGRCVKDTEIKIVDVDTRELLGPNVKGEFLIKSPYLFSGYYKTDTSFAFDEDGFLKTGDIAYYDEDEFVYFVGRIKETFKYRTYAVVPSFLEKILLEHPAVKEAAVFGIPKLEDRNWPAALVTLKQNCSVSAADIESFYTPKVADHHKLRGGIKIISEFDKTPNGKIQRKFLMEKFLSIKV